MQKSVLKVDAVFSARMCTIGGQIQRRLVAGFSGAAGITSREHSRSTEHENLRRAFPTSTLRWSTSFRFGSPIGMSSLRNRGGPLGLSRAREKLEHGVPSHTATT